MTRTTPAALLQNKRLYLALFHLLPGILNFKLMKFNPSKILFFTVLVSAMLLLSCKKVIEINFEDTANQLVIEGIVTNASNMQTVKISKSVAVTAASNFPAVSGATVGISSNGTTYALREISAGNYRVTGLRGQPGRTYQLNISYNGQNYTATSTMPNQVRLDSLGLDVTSVVGKEFKSVSVAYTDPAATTNYYRFLLSVNNVPSANYFIYTDQLTNGRPVNRNLRDGDLNLKTGDVATIEMQCIDQNVYQYWNGLSQNENRGGASTTPANPVSNISNGALGYFSAHTAQTVQLTIK
ncbi:MAG: DUF4249 domain-containing protein [Sphingobacteriaceae bacterium]|nr:MAG: DUF4249 domain-containing protein [Sphingobacteriaceae bacterium]